MNANVLLDLAPSRLSCRKRTAFNLIEPISTAVDKANASRFVTNPATSEAI
jgi:hypothetical protein